MPDMQNSSDVLLDILKVLKRIDEQLEKQGGCFAHLENLINTRDDASDASTSSKRQSQGFPNMPEREKCKIIHDSSQYTTSILGPRSTAQASLIRYSDWSIDQYKQEPNKEFVAMLEKRLGEYSKIPIDFRLPLKIFKSHLRSREDYWETQVTTHSKGRLNVEVQLYHLRRFDIDHRHQRGNDFLVIDFDAVNNSRLYRVGEKAVGNELMVESDNAENPPWSRLILYQGMTTGNSIPNERKSNGPSPEPIPYFGRSDTTLGLWNHIFSHLQLKRRESTVNPYLDRAAGFHTVFYEIRKGNDLKLNELWKHGPLYDHPLGWSFRKSAYTLYCSTKLASAVTPEANDVGPTRHWTILLLAPDYFYDENNTSFPMAAMDVGRVKALGHCLGRLSQLGAEMNLIGHGLERISGRWAEFQSFFDFILDGGDSLMQPAEHDNLLFDDGAFSRSRRYFWAIDCLSEFELCISDNISQWELYKKARVVPLLAAELLSELELNQFKNVERQCYILQNQREYFIRRLASTKALRDALFNASAVIESRASTRLGENVKLLTFVSIFFLPLAFCTSLWSINDKFSSTTLIIVIIVVALFTYLTMFNINSLVNTFSRVYDIKKRRIVRAMKSDSDEAWQHRGQRFEVFRPKHENPEPSEWYITLYTFLHPLALLGIHRRKADAKQQTEKTQRDLPPTRHFGFRNLFRRPSKPKEPEPPPDEAWVM